MSKKQIYLGQECTVNQLDEFIGRKVFITLNDEINFQYSRFSWNINDDDTLIFVDESDYSGDCKTYIPMKKVDLIKNISDDMYRDVIDIDFEDKRISICCAERKPIPVKCDRCGHIFEEDEMQWRINQTGQYTSVYDGELVCIKLCDDCIKSLININ